MTDLPAIARSLAQKLAPLHEWLHDGTPRHYTERCEAKMLEALRDVRNQALGEAEQAIRRAPSLDENGYITEKSAAITAIRALIDTPASEVPDPRDAEIERRTVEMPLSDANDLDAVVHALGIEDSDTTPAEAVAELHAEIERLREVVRTMDAALEPFEITNVFPLPYIVGTAMKDVRWTKMIADLKAAREAARQTLDREPTGDET